MRWGVRQVREYVQPGEGHPFFERVRVVTWSREPDFSDDYVRLYDLEQELSPGSTFRRDSELLSVWRLARDPAYACWAAEFGPPKCQVTLFGLEETTDWFYQRRGAFRDCLVATERLLEVGTLPRWQLFLTRKILPEVDDLLRLVDRLRLHERCAALGGAFVLFIHSPAPDGAARGIEHLRPELEETFSLTEELLAASRRHVGLDPLWRTETELIAEIGREPERFPCAYSPRDPFFLIFQSNWDVFANTATQERWWCLGNLKREPLSVILERYESHATPGLQAIYSLTAKELAARFGDASGRRVYADRDDLVALWVAKACEVVR